MIRFTIGGRAVEPSDMADAVTAAVLEALRERIADTIGSMRDPETGEFPTVVVRGDDLDELTVHVEGSPALVALVKERLGMDATEEEAAETRAEAGPGGAETPPRVFLSYASEDVVLAERLAGMLQANGVDTWWDKWCIGPGDSLRRRIDEGLGDCTHFLVLLTPRSISKPWVAQEMDAGLVRMLADRCRFLPVRHGLPAEALPPLLSGMHSPAIADDGDISRLVADIHGVTRKPPLGPPPVAVRRAAGAETGYSAAASAVARLFVERSREGLFGDPQIDVGTLAAETGLGREDVEDALHELKDFVTISSEHVLAKGDLFAEFDRHWMPWNPAEDALRLAAAIVNDPDFPSDCRQVAERLGWEPRRLNPVVSYLLERRLIVDFRALGTMPWAIARIVGTDGLRRFVRSRT
jgi:hypothetical protein